MSVADISLVDKGLPRRLSVRPNDPHYDHTAKRLSDRIAVLLDGAELPEVAAWDVDAGTVVRQRRHQGQLVLDEQGVPTYETLRGLVEVRWAPKKGAQRSPEERS